MLCCITPKLQHHEVGTRLTDCEQCRTFESHKQRHIELLQQSERTNLIVRTCERLMEVVGNPSRVQ